MATNHHVGWIRASAGPNCAVLPLSFRTVAARNDPLAHCFAVTGTDLDDTGADAYDNDAVKFTVSYGMDFEL